MRRSERPGEPLRVALFAYPDVQALDLSGPLEMFARATRLLRDEGRTHPGYSLAVIGTRAGPITASSGFRFLPDTTFGALRGSNRHPARPRWSRGRGAARRSGRAGMAPAQRGPRATPGVGLHRRIPPGRG